MAFRHHWHEQGGISYLEMARVFAFLQKIPGNYRKFQEIPGNSSFADKNSSFADQIPVRTENSRNFQHFRVLTGAGVVSSARAKLDMPPLRNPHGPVQPGADGPQKIHKKHARAPKQKKNRACGGLGGWLAPAELAQGPLTNLPTNFCCWTGGDHVGVFACLPTPTFVDVIWPPATNSWGGTRG